MRLIVKGLEGRPKYRDEARAIRLSGFPKYVKILDYRLLEYQSDKINTHLQGILPQAGQTIYQGDGNRNIK